MAQQAKQNEERRQAQEQAHLQAIEAAKPINRLAMAYQAYVQVQLCYKQRQGYQIVWVNDVEMDRARRAIKAIEQKFTKDDPSIDTNKLWQSVLTPMAVDQDLCRFSVNQLLATWSQIGPSDFSAEKDF
jgi:hypothetical protein